MSNQSLDGLSAGPRARDTHVAEHHIVYAVHVESFLGHASTLSTMPADQSGIAEVTLHRCRQTGHIPRRNEEVIAPGVDRLPASRRSVVITARPIAMASWIEWGIPSRFRSQ